ncbi:6-bladed beta-propeller [Gemmatimonadota bacterium]
MNLRSIPRNSVIVLAVLPIFMAVQPQHTILVDEPILRLGTEESGKLFSRIADFGWSDSGNFYVLDNRECSVSIFDSSGQFVAAFGKNGAGPGEFGRPFELQVIDESVFVLDVQLGRLSEFSLNGDFRTSIRLDYSPNDFVVTTDDIYYITNTFENMLYRIPRDSLNHSELILKSTDVIELQSNDNQLLRLATRVRLIGDELVISIPGYIKLIFVSFDGQFRVVEPKCKELDAFVRYYIRTRRDWRTGGVIGSYPQTIRSFTSWTDGNLLMDVWMGEEQSTSLKSKAVIIDILTGEDTGYSIGSEQTRYADFRPVPGNRLCAYNIDEATLDFFLIH